MAHVTQKKYSSEQKEAFTHLFNTLARKYDTGNLPAKYRDKMGRIKQYSDSNGTYRTNRKINFLEILMADPDTQGHLQSLFKKQMEGEVAKTETDNKDNNDDQ